MTLSDVLRRPVVDAEKLRTTLESLDSHPDVGRLLANLDSAIAQIRDGRIAEERPPVVCLLGGTGVGKSSLFNALTEMPEASKASITRFATKAPFVAVSGKHRSWAEGFFTNATVVPFPDRQQQHWCLVDTPDINTICTANREVTNAILTLSDVVIFVTDRQMYKDQEIHTHFSEWAKRKNWLFVMNKADEVVDSDLPSLRDDWFQFLATCGFAVSEENVFCVSANQIGRHDFARLRNALQTISPQYIGPVRLVNSLGELSRALDDDALGRLSEVEQNLREGCERLNKEFHEALNKGIQSPRIRSLLRTMLRERTWQAVAANTIGPILVAVWLQARLTGVQAIYSIGRYFLRGTGLLGLTALVGASLVDSFRRQMALIQIVSVMRNDRALSWSDLEKRATMILEDNRLENWRPVPVHVEDSQEDGSGWPLAAIRYLERRHQQWLRHTGLTTNDPALVTALDLTIDGLAASRAARVTFWPWQLLANALPVVALGNIFWRLGEAWYREQYLPWAFYGMAIGLFVMSCTPGLTLFWGLVTREVRRDMAAEFGEQDVPSGFAQNLEDAADAVRDTLIQTERLRERIAIARQALQREFTHSVPTAIVQFTDREAA